MNKSKQEKHQPQTFELNNHDKDSPIQQKSQLVGRIITRAISRNRQTKQKHENSEMNGRKLSDVSERVSTLPNNKKINRFHDQTKELKNQFGKYEHSQHNAKSRNLMENEEKSIEKKEKKQAQKWQRSKSYGNKIKNENIKTMQQSSSKRDQRLRGYEVDLRNKLNNLSHQLDSLQTSTSPFPSPQAKRHKLKMMQSKADQSTRKLSYPLSQPSQQNQQQDQIKNLSPSTSKLPSQLSDQDEDVFFYGQLHHKCIHCANLSLKREEIKIPTGLKNIKLTNLSDNLKHKSHLFS